MVHGVRAHARTHAHARNITSRVSTWQTMESASHRHRTIYATVQPDACGGMRYAHRSFGPITVCGLAMVVTVQAFSNNAYVSASIYTYGHVCGMPARMCASQPLCDHWSMLMKGFVNVMLMKGNFVPPPLD